MKKLLLRHKTIHQRGMTGHPYFFIDESGVNLLSSFATIISALINEHFWANLHRGSTNPGLSYTSVTFKA